MKNNILKYFILLLSVLVILTVYLSTVGLETDKFNDQIKKKISPIQIKSGNAVSVQLEAPVHIVVIIASPAGREVNNSMPIHATPIKERPTQTELPNKKNSEKRNITVAKISVI